MERQQIIDALYRFAHQRPGLEWGNYASGNYAESLKSYRSESRSITRDLRDARFLLRQLELSSITTDALIAAFRAYSGRLSVTETPEGKVRLEYCTGQYWPTEYRKGVCAVCAAALWDHYREDYAAAAKPGESAGDAIRRNFRRNYGARLAARWFN